LESTNSVVLTNPDGSQKTLSKSNISLILDRKGKDITAEVLHNGSHDALNQNNLDKYQNNSNNGTYGNNTGLNSAKASRSGLGQNYYLVPRFRLCLFLGYGYSMTTGRWFDGLTDGSAIITGARISITENIFLGFNYRRQGIGVDQDYLENLFHQMYGHYDVNISADATFNEFFFAVGWMTEPFRPTQPLGFTEFGIGSINHKFEFKIDTDYPEQSLTTDENKLALLWTGGAIIPFNENVGICIKGSMRLTGSGSQYEYGVEYQGTSGLLLGLDTELVFLF
jgi:hypothetical protein